MSLTKKIIIVVISLAIIIPLTVQAKTYYKKGWFYNSQISKSRLIKLYKRKIRKMKKNYSKKTIIQKKTKQITKDKQKSETEKILWSNNFTNRDWQSDWQIQSKGKWGIDNVEIIEDSTKKFNKILRVHYPKNSASPTVAKTTGAPWGGAQFYSTLNIQPKDKLHLRYYVRFADNFDFVKGGKLPGLYSGTENNGGKTPDGTNGFSTRYMWRKDGAGEVYAYLKTSTNYGTALGKNNWKFKTGEWQLVEQQVKLNTPGQTNGEVRVWIDEKLVLEQDGLIFRTIEDLKIEGIFFSTFFGGGDPSWATPVNTYADFANFAVDDEYIGA